MSSAVGKSDANSNRTRLAYTLVNLLLIASYPMAILVKMCRPEVMPGYLNSLSKVLFHATALPKEKSSLNGTEYDLPRDRF